MAVATITIELHLLGVETGVWCDACALPSAMTMRVVGVDPATLHPLVRVTRSACGDCGRSWEKNT